MTAPNETSRQAAERLCKSILAKGYELEALHAYTDEAGHELLWRIRLRNRANGRKEIRPMRREPDGGFTLHEPVFARGRKPLYRLHDLAQRPDEPVFIVEGESCADALAHLGVLATTSGGASSAAGVDIEPLRGRETRLWADNDGPGHRYVEALAQRLSAAGCAVRMVEVSGLGLSEAEDCVDWLTAHPGATADDLKALPLVDVKTPEVNGFQYENGRFELTDDGLWFQETDDKGRDGRRRFVCSPLRVTAKTRDASNVDWGCLVEWADSDGVPHTWSMPAELLEGEGVEVRRELARGGVRIAPTRKGRDLLTAFLKLSPAESRVRCVPCLGWHGAVFVTPVAAVGATIDRVVFQSSSAVEPALGACGTVAEWRDTVGALSCGNSRLVFAVCCAFAPTLLDFVTSEGGGFHLVGGSSTGKTTALHAAASVWGLPSKYVRTWRATANGLEGLAAVHSDGLLVLDELSQCDPREAGEAAYLLANGQGKARAARSGVARPAASWRLLFLSAGEEPLSAVMARAGKRPNAGQEVRLAEIGADAGQGLGAFETLHGVPTAAEFARRIKDAAASTYGAVGQEWIRRVVADRQHGGLNVTDEAAAFAERVLPSGSSGQAERVAQRFGLVATAGELGSRYGLTGWPEGEATRAAVACFRSWLDGFGGPGNREERAILEQVRAFFEAHGSSRFEDKEKPGERPVINRVGFFSVSPAGRLFYVLPEAFKSQICAGVSHRAAEKVLLARGWLEAGGDGRATQKVRLPGCGEGSTRCYVFSPRVWDDGPSVNLGTSGTTGTHRDHGGNPSPPAADCWGEAGTLDLAFARLSPPAPAFPADLGTKKPCVYEVSPVSPVSPTPDEQKRAAAIHWLNEAADGPRWSLHRIDDAVKQRGAGPYANRALPEVVIEIAREQGHQAGTPGKSLQVSPKTPTKATTLVSGAGHSRGRVPHGEN